jgi:Lrp/AsnC family transcriptional regulator
MDRVDRKILALLQANGNVPGPELAKAVGISTTPCWRRVQKLEKEKIIRRRVALLDAAKINAAVTVFVSVRVNNHSPEWLRRFSEVVASFPEVVEFYRMSGDVDYLMRIAVPDVAGYDAFYRRLVAKVDIGDVSSAFAMQELKFTTELPLSYLAISNPKEARG